VTIVLLPLWNTAAVSSKDLKKGSAGLKANQRFERKCQTRPVDLTRTNKDWMDLKIEQGNE